MFDLDKKGKVYVRINDKSIQASQENIEILKRSKSNKSLPLCLGQEEYLLFRQIDKLGKVTISNFMEASGLSRRRASQTLIRMVVSNVLRIEIGEKEDYFLMRL